MNLRIGITQRVEEMPAYGERRDCLDQQWLVLLEQLGFMPVPIPNCLEHLIGWFEEMALVGFVLSGGNDLAHLPNASRPAPERDKTEKCLLEYAAGRNIPVLGVCRGLQLMNDFLGGQLAPVQGHVATRHEVVAVPGDPLFARYQEVNSYHGWGVPADGVARELKPRLNARDGGVEAVTCDQLKWVGIMWHPERETPFALADTQLIKQLFKGEK